MVIQAFFLESGAQRSRADKYPTGGLTQLVRIPWLPCASGDSGPTGHDQEGRRGLKEVVPGTSVFPLSETSVLGDFWGRIKGAKYRFAFQDGTWDIF